MKSKRDTETRVVIELTRQQDSVVYFSHGSETLSSFWILSVSKSLVSKYTTD